MTQIMQALFSGFATGAIYALLAIGFVIIFKATHVISFAQPGLMILGAVGVSYLATVRSVSWPIAVVIAVVTISALAVLIERLAMRPLIGRPVFIASVATLGIDIALRVGANRYIGSTVRSVGDPWGRDAFTLGGVVFEHRHLAAIVTTAAIAAGLFAFFKFTKFGLAMRAVALDQETSMLQGVSVSKVFMFSWAIAGATAAIAGVFIGMGSGMDQSSWMIALKALPAIIIGGLDSIEGALAGGLIVGVVEALVAVYQPLHAPWLGANFAVVAPYLLMLLVLLVRPYGLFGTREVVRV